MKRIGKITAVLLTAGMMLSMLTGCGQASKDSSVTGLDSMPAPAAGYAAEEAVEEEYDSGFYEENAEMPSSSPGSVLKAQQQVGDKLIYSGNIEIQTLDYDASVESIHKKITDCGGFLQSEDESDGNYAWYYESSSYSTRIAGMQARIPAESFSSFMDSLEEDGQVMSRHVNVENITQTYTETEATVKAYEIERDRLLEMMDKAETIEDMIAVEARLSEVESELNIYKTDLAGMDRDVEYSTIYISVEEVREYTEEPDDSTFFSRLKETFRNSWRAFRAFLEGFLHFIIYLIPFAVLIFVIFLIVRAVSRKLDEKRPERKARKLARKQQKEQLKYQQKMQKEQFRQQQKMARRGMQGQPPSGAPQGPAQQQDAAQNMMPPAPENRQEPKTEAGTPEDPGKTDRS